MIPKISRHLPRITLVLFLGLVIILAFALFQPNLSAQEETTKLDTSHWTEVMRRQYEERPAAPLTNEILSAIPCVGGFADIYPCNNVDLLALMPHSSIGGGGGNDIWGWVDPTNGNEYALVGQTNGTAFVDITDPENPVYLGRLNPHTSNSIWRDIKVYADHAFVVSEAGGHGMQVFDLTELRNVPNPPVVFPETAWYDGTGSAHNIAINEDTGYAYIVGAGQCSGGLHMVDISTPTNPTFAGCFSGDGYTHDVQCIVYNGPDVTYQGDEICFAANEDTLTIVNVTDKANPVQLSRTGYTGEGYSHQGWITADHAYFLLDDELDELNFGHNTTTYLWDVSDLDSPSNFANYVGPRPHSDHNLYIKDGYAFESNYSGGLEILDLSDLANGNLTETGFFDTYPAHNNAGFDGQWSNFPYFPSGTVISNDSANGLFILQPVLAPDFAISTQDTTLAICGDGTASTLVELEDRHGYQGTVTLSSLGLPNGAGATFTPPQVDVPGNSTLDVTTSGVSAGEYPFTVEGTDGNLTHDTPMTLFVADGAPAAPNLVSPPDGANNQPVQPTFTWDPAAQAASYEIEVATDANFNNIVYAAADIAGTSHTPDMPLPAGFTLYWRVRAENACGAGTNSATFSFTTALCANPNLSIPDNDPAGVTYEFVMPDTGTISDLDTSIEVVHSWVGDLVFEMEHVDTGTSVVFYDRPGVPASTFGCSGDDIDATLDDEAGSPVENACGGGVPSIQGSFIPNNLLSAFDGESSAGTWRITASDLAGGVTGNLNTWCIEMETTGGPTPTATSPAATATSPAPTETSGPPTATAISLTPTPTAPATDVELSSFNGQMGASWLVLLLLVAVVGLFVTYFRTVNKD